MKHRKFYEFLFSIRNSDDRKFKILTIAGMTFKFKKREMVDKQPFSSTGYWEKRYSSGQTSGAGAFGHLAEFKSQVINDFIRQNNIESVIEFGFGDGNQLALYDLPKYIGFEISQTIVDKVARTYINDPNKIFKNINQYNGEKGELAMSIEVVFLIPEDNIFNEYMHRLFDSSTKFVIIFSSNRNEVQSEYLVHRKFTDWIQDNAKNWKKIKYIKNKYTDNGILSPERSFSDFYIYEKINNEGI